MKLYVHSLVDKLKCEEMLISEPSEYYCIICGSVLLISVYLLVL